MIMNKKRLPALLLTPAILCGLLSACADEHTSLPVSEDKKSADDSTWSVAGEETVTLHNDRIDFQLDATTGHFSLTDRTTGHVFSSVPEKDVATLSDEDEQRLQSEVTVTYFERQSVAYYLYSAADCVDLGQMEVRYSDNAVRVYYQLGATYRFVPTVIDQDTFENSIIPALDNSAKTRKLNRYYTLYDKSDPEDGYDDMLKQYPALKNTNLYILNADELNDNELSIVNEYMTDAGYSAEQHSATLDRLGVQETATATQAGFTIPVEYRLTDDGFSAAILTDRIVEQSPDFILQSVDLLEYFAAADGQENGYFLVPDGCGALIPFNSEFAGDFEQDFYGDDYATQTEKKNQLSQNLTLPVFGVSKPSGGVFAIVENAAQVATLCVKPLNESSPLNHAYLHFTLRKMDATDIGEDNLVPIYNLFAGHRLQTDPTVRFVLLEDGQQDYVGMAKTYREYCLDHHQLNQPDTNNGATLYLDFLCMTSQQDSFLGMPYTKKTVLSSIKDITETVRKLQQAGWQNLNVRLFGYGDNGLENGVPDKFRLSKKVGTVEELKALAECLHENGGTLYLDADVQFVYTTHLGDGFHQKTDASHYLNRSIVYQGQYDTVTRQFSKTQLPRFFVSPTNHPIYATAFRQSLEKVCKDTPIGLSYGTFGTGIGGDYTDKKDIDRTQSAVYTDTTLSEATAHYSLIADTGNQYVLPYTTHILNAPLTSSRFDVESDSVPFYELVVHGNVGYAGSPENLSGDYRQQFLRSLEYGAMPYLVCITEPDDALVGTPYETSLYSLNCKRIDSVLQAWNEVKAYLDSIGGCSLTAHEKISENVYRTVYDNGHGVIVNYTDQPVNAAGYSVPANGFVTF